MLCSGTARNEEPLRRSTRSLQEGLGGMDSLSTITSYVRKCLDLCDEQVI